MQLLHFGFFLRSHNFLCNCVHCLVFVFKMNVLPVSLDDVPSPLEFVSENLPSRTNSEKMTNRGPSQSSLNKGKGLNCFT